MLKKIKSITILKKIFSNIETISKLNLIHYNKNLQYKLNIDLIDYRRCIGRYIIFDENGEGKEYNSYNDQLIYEGEYLNGKRNGEGKEYNYEGKLIFEGEFKNGKIWNGLRTQYNYNGNLIFICEYLNGERNGKGEIFDNNRLVFDGEYLNGKKHGKAEEYDYNGNLVFEGE